MFISSCFGRWWTFWVGHQQINFPKYGHDQLEMVTIGQQQEELSMNHVLVAILSPPVRAVYKSCYFWSTVGWCQCYSRSQTSRSSSVDSSIYQDGFVYQCANNEDLMILLAECLGHFQGQLVGLLTACWIRQAHGWAQKVSRCRWASRYCRLWASKCQPAQPRSFWGLCDGWVCFESHASAFAHAFLSLPSSSSLPPPYLTLQSRKTDPLTLQHFRN